MKMGDIMKTLDRAIEWSGGVTRLAEGLGVDQSAVSHWKRRNKIPPSQAMSIQRWTKGHVTADQILRELERV